MSSDKMTRVEGSFLSACQHRENCIQLTFVSSNVKICESVFLPSP
jgi:hypothetical protein